MAEPDKAQVQLVQQLLNHILADVQAVRSWELVVEKLTAMGLSWRVQMQPDQVGIHQGNRSKFGIDATNMNAHGSTIIKKGFSWKKSEDCTAIEMPSDPASVAEAIASNFRVVELSGGYIPKLSAMKALSLGGANTNGFLRAARARCPTMTEFADANGRWSTDGLMVKDEHLKAAIEKGLWWTLLDKRCAELWPSLPNAAQKALNLRQSTETGEMEGLLSLFELRRGRLEARLGSR